MAPQPELGRTLCGFVDSSQIEALAKRFHFIITDRITDRACLQTALDGAALAAGIDARAIHWDPEVVTNPPTRAGITTPHDQADLNSRNTSSSADCVLWA
jgi:hypothetical protein